MAENRIRTNEEIDALNQFSEEGETPLPYETNEANETDKPEDETKIEGENNQEQIDATKQKELDAEIAKNKTIEAEKNKIVPEELTDEKVLAYLKNKTGKEISFDELLNPKKELSAEEKQAQADQREANKFAYGLTKGLFTKNQLESFITDTKNPKELVFELYAKDQKEKDSDLTDAEIREEFNEKFALDSDESSRQYKAGQNLLNRIANDIITQKHSKILNLDNDFTSYETSQSTIKEREAKILSQAPLYKKDVEEVRKSIKKLSIPMSDNDIFEIDLDDTAVNDIIAPLLETNFSANQIENGWDKNNLLQTVQTLAIMKQLPRLMNDYRDKALLEKQAGIRGVQPNGKQGEKGAKAMELTDDQKKALSYFDAEASLAN